MKINWNASVSQLLTVFKMSDIHKSILPANIFVSLTVQLKSLKFARRKNWNNGQNSSSDINIKVDSFWMI
jgi:hypothetical protein